MPDFFQDVRYGLRMLWKSPGFTAASLLTLALCVGANTAMFTLVNAILLRPLPYPGADRLVWVREYLPHIHNDVALGPDYVNWRDSAHSFKQIAAYDSDNFNLSGAGEPVRVEAAQVTSTFFPLFGVQPGTGRPFSREEDKPGASPVTVLTYTLWQSHFGGADDAIGKRILLNGIPHTIVGVMPAEFRFPDESIKPDVLLPMPLTPYDPAEKSFRMVNIVGRLAPGSTSNQAAAELDVINRQAHVHDPDDNWLEDMHVEIKSLQEQLVGSYRRALQVLMLTVLLVLLIGCVNVANLQLARAAARKREISVRSALGASRIRLMRQLLTENLVLAVGGGVAGLALAAWIVGVLRTVHIGALPNLSNISLDQNVFAFAVLVIGGTSLLFGMAPAIVATGQRDIHLNVGSRSTSSASHRRLSSVLVMSELALAMMLLAGAGLLIRTFVGLIRTDPGFRSEGILTAKLTLADAKYTNREQRRAFFEELLQRLRALPGVTSAAVGSSLPLAGHAMHGVMRAEGQPELPPNQAPSLFLDSASPDYFRALGMTIIEGRTFTAADAGGSIPPVILNQAAAAKFFPGQRAVGKHITMVRANQWSEIVGVVGSVRDNGLDQEASPQLYFPLGHAPWPTRIVIRTVGDPAAYANLLRVAIRSIDADQPIFDVATMKVQLADSLTIRRLNMLLLSAFAGLALLLAGIGIYGVISYSVVQRTQEIGIRLALGADRSCVVRLIVAAGSKLVLGGVILGVLGFLALVRFMSSLLFGVQATDAVTLTAGITILASVALAASYIPARRAAKVDPMIALRYE
ncbi:MAG TPA: ABC transporter permease [Terriglobales bacterium]|jgi:putative ABC transport system permease protein